MNRVVRYAPVVKKYAHNTILFRKNLDDLKAVGDCVTYRFRPATREDFDFIVKHPEALPGRVYSRRLERGDRCYCLTDESAVLSYNWVAFSLCCVLCGFDRGIEFLPLSDRQAFTYDFYTYKTMRGGGIGGLTKKLLLEELARQGIQEVFSLVMPYSTSSLKIHLQLGYEPLCLVYGYRILGWSRTYFGKPKEKAWLDAWIGDFKAANRLSGNVP